jgi:RNA polymerase sigma-32 factor
MQTASSRNNFSIYVSEASRYPLVDAEQEQRLARKYRQTGDRQIAQKLVTSNLRFVVKVASEYRRYGLSLADLVQEGNLGLMRAVEKFDPLHGVRLISYAVWWIRAYIQDYILRSWSLVKIGTTQIQRRLFFSLARAKREMERLGGPDDPQDRIGELALQLGAKPQEIIEMEQRMSGRDLSLDAPIEDGGSTPLEVMPSAEQPADEKVADAQSIKLLAKQVADAMAKLDSRERYIIERRVLDERPETFQGLGDHFGISRERARQLELRAKEKLQELLGKSLDVTDDRRDGRAAGDRKTLRGLREDLLTRGGADRHYGGVFELSLHRDGVEALA